MHFRAGIGGDTNIVEAARLIVVDLDDLNGSIKLKNHNLEQTLAQLENYQQQMQTLRQKILHEEQQLRLVLAPTYLPHDRERAITEQQVRNCFWRFVIILILFFDIYAHRVKFYCKKIYINIHHQIKL